MADQAAADVPVKWHTREFKRLKCNFESDFESEAITANITKSSEEVVSLEVTNYQKGIFVGPIGTIWSFQEDRPRGIALLKLQQSAIHLDIALSHKPF
jgi:hypothetical protein